MPLARGQRLGPYEVLGPIGAGGMGEVFRARDGKLSREVALKVLPDHLSDDPKALARFESEAKAVAALSHPHILSIHDFGRIGGVSFAVMELLEGETLRGHLQRGALPLRKALELASQVSDALAAAHEKGIVHRDVKPENVFVTKEGRAKLLDFGLARRDGAWRGEADTRSPTVAEGTAPGTVLGTVAYMSPEQAQGLPADHRSDQFSLGVVLYEALTGKRAFVAPTAAETLTAILRSEPEPVERHAPATPAPVRWILDRLLAKDPAERYESTRDLARELETCRVHLSEASSSRVEELGERRRLRLSGFAAVTVLLAIALGTLLGWAVRARRQRPPTTATFTRVTSWQGVESEPTLSPDGETLAFVRGGDVWVQRVGGYNATNLTADNEGGDGAPAFSPDGRRIAFHSVRDGTPGVFVMGASGESVRRVTTFGTSPAWFPDGRNLAFASHANSPYGVYGGDLWAVDLEGGAPRKLPAGDKAFDPAVSPDGRWIAFWGIVEGRHGIHLVDAGRTPASRPVPVYSSARPGGRAGYPVWSADGGTILFTSDEGGVPNLWRRPVDAGTGKPAGPAEPFVLPTANAAFLRASRDGGRLVWASQESECLVERYELDPVREEVSKEFRHVLRETSSPDRPDVSPDVSPKGDLLAYQAIGAVPGIWIVRPDGTVVRKLTEFGRGPCFSPDGARVLFYEGADPARLGLWTIGVDGANATRFVKEVGVDAIWHPGGRLVATAIHTPTRPSPFDLCLIPWPRSPDEPLPKPVPPPRPDISVTPSSFSHDGARLAAEETSIPSGRNGIWLLELARGAWTLVSERGLRPVFLSDGKRLLAQLGGTAGGGEIVLLDSRTRRTKPLLSGTPERSIDSFALSRDERSLYVVTIVAESDIWLAELREPER